MVGGWSAPDEQPAALRRVPGPWVMKSVHDLAPPPREAHELGARARGVFHGAEIDKGLHQAMGEKECMIGWRCKEIERR